MKSKSNLFENVQETLSNRLKPWERTMQFWVRAVNVYTSYKICQIRVKYVKGKEKQERMWEDQHEIAADRIYSLCYDLGGFFLKAAQIIGKPDLAPNAWVKKLVTLCDDAPATPFEAVQFVIEKELERKPNEIFERFERIPIGSASVAQVHRARIKGGTSDVAVKVQHPGAQDIMMTDIRNLKFFAAYLQKTDIRFDLVSLVQEMEKQVDYEFDFWREAKSMEKIGEFLKTINKGKPSVIVPRPIWGMITRSILKDLTTAYGQMILKSGFFHADPHPGNILVTKDTKVALLDYGQVKDLPDVLRLGYAGLIMALVSGDPLKIGKSFEELGIRTLTKASDNPIAFKNLAQMMFDTKLPPGVKMASPYGEGSSLNDVPVQSFPEELFFVLRTIQLLRGLSVGMGINYSCAEEWRQMAEEALSSAGRCIDSQRKNDKGIGKKLRFWRRKQRV